MHKGNQLNQPKTNCSPDGEVMDSLFMAFLLSVIRGGVGNPLMHYFKVSKETSIKIITRVVRYSIGVHCKPCLFTIGQEEEK